MRADRRRLVDLARAKPIAPYDIDESLTFFCPQENVEALEHPAVLAMQRWKRESWMVPADSRRILLLMPCQKVKPYPLSAEHIAINGALLRAGFAPSARGDWPEQLSEHVADPRLLSNAPLVGRDYVVDRAVISEPFGLVPYDVVYRFAGGLSPAARYDDPGMFEHRGLGAAWRADNTCEEVRPGFWRWGDNERAAYADAHNQLAERIAEDLERVREAYCAIYAWVAPGMPHRSFLADRAERRAAKLPLSRRAHGRDHRLVGVNDRYPGMVRVRPQPEQLATRRHQRGGQLTATPLQDPVVLDDLVRELVATPVPSYR